MQRAGVVYVDANAMTLMGINFIFTLETPFVRTIAWNGLALACRAAETSRELPRRTMKINNTSRGRGTLTYLNTL
jgi:hypothetical protein